MKNKHHTKLVDIVCTSLRERGYYDYVRKEFPVYDKKNRQRYAADVAGFKYDEKTGLYDVTAFEIKTGIYRNAHKKAKKQSSQWFQRINCNLYPMLSTRNFVVVHAKKGIYRIND